ncbi:MAG: hypothetical protein JW966_00120 [Anaerolineae bacterium]|nr:hypothetical protein [Anaerolineae bacterium]
MSAQPRNVNIENLFQPGRAARIEFWQDNGDGTCTRLHDGLTLTYVEYSLLPDKHFSARQFERRQDSWLN